MPTQSPSGEYQNQITDHYVPKLIVSADELEAIKAFPRGDVLTHGATPLDQIATLDQQQQAQFELRHLTTSASDTIPLEIVSYVVDTFVQRFVNRAEANNENFVTRLVIDYLEKLDPEYIEIIDRARLGHASPAELILVRDLLGIRSVELACLTHPYGENIHQLEVMRESAKQAIELFGGEVYDKPEPRYRIKDVIGVDNDSLLIDGRSPGILMTRKRTIGILPDGTIVRERSSFVLRLDEKSLLYEILGQDAIEELKNISNLDDVAQEQALKQYKDVISAFLLLDEFEQAIPVSTTIYAYNKETADLVEAVREERTDVNAQIYSEHNEMSDDEWNQIQDEIDEERRLTFERHLQDMRLKMAYFNDSTGERPPEESTSESHPE